MTALRRSPRRSVNYTNTLGWLIRHGVVRDNARILSATSLTTIQGKTQQTQDVDPMMG